MLSRSVGAAIVKSTRIYIDPNVWCMTGILSDIYAATDECSIEPGHWAEIT